MATSPAVTPPATDSSPVLLSLTEAAEVLGVSRRTAYTMARNSTFPVPVLRIGALWKVNREALERFTSGS